MRFNNYVWDLYKTSPEGKERIDYFQPRNNFPDDKYALVVKEAQDIISLKNIGLSKYIKGDKVNYRQLRHDYLGSAYKFDKENIRELYAKWIKEGIKVGDFVIFALLIP